MKDINDLAGQVGERIRCDNREPRTPIDLRDHFGRNRFVVAELVAGVDTSSTDIPLKPNYVDLGATDGVTGQVEVKGNCSPSENTYFYLVLNRILA